MSTKLGQRTDGFPKGWIDEILRSPTIEFGEDAFGTGSYAVYFKTLIAAGGIDCLLVTCYIFERTASGMFNRTEIKYGYNI